MFRTGTSELGGSRPRIWFRGESTENHVKLPIVTSAPLLRLHSSHVDDDGARV
jgi:hypothetical protein